MQPQFLLNNKMEGNCLITSGKLFQTVGPWNCKVFWLVRILQYVLTNVQFMTSVIFMNHMIRLKVPVTIL